jgi:DNA segregation ATPase FtsK/SpoIIIE, S-DNA-T family
MLVLLVVALLLVIAAVGAGWLLAIWLVVKRPILGVPIVVYVGLVMWIGAHDAQALAIYAVIVLIAWRLAHKPSYQRLVGWRLRSSWRRLWVYDRRWRAAMVLSGLGRQYRLRHHIPRIQSVQSEPWGDRVLIRLAIGQSTADIERVAPQLAHSFGARACRVREDRPGRLWLLFEIDDPPGEPVPGERARPADGDCGPRSHEDGDPSPELDDRSSVQPAAAPAALEPPRSEIERSTR